MTMSETKHGRGWNRYATVNGHSGKALRRESAMKRQAATAKLTPQQKLDRLDKIGVSAVRERARLQKKIDAGISRAENTEKVEKKKQRTQKAAEEHAAAIQGK